MGAGLLFGINVMRIVSLYYVGVYRPAWFDWLHSEVWPLGLVGIAVGAFIMWTRWAAAASDARG